jgi:hypothetical protein
MRIRTPWNASRGSRLRLAALSGLLLVGPAGCGEDPVEPEDPQVRILRPNGRVHIRASVHIQVEALGDAVSQVELLKDGEPLASLSAPYAYTWDTTTVPEGTHVLTARVTQRGQTFISGPLEVVVDRTAPTVVSRRPVPGDTAEWDGVISFTASEPLNPFSLTDESVTLREDGAEIRGKPRLSLDAKTVEVVLRQPLTLPSDFSLSLAPGLTDLAGNPLVITGEAWSWTAPTWRLLKAPTQESRRAFSHPPSLVLDGEEPVLGFTEVNDLPLGEDLGGETVVTRWTGAGWERFPRITEATGRTWLATDGRDGLFLAGSGAAVSDSVPFHVLRWDGRGWPAVAPPKYLSIRRMQEEWLTDGVRLAVTPSGSPLLSWEIASIPDPSATHPTVERVEAGAWAPVWSLETAPFSASSLALTVDAGGTPWMVHVEHGTPSRTYVSRWDGTAFVKLGGSLEEDAGSPASTAAADLKVDASGTPYLVRRDAARLYLQRWNGTRWETLSSQEAPGTINQDPERDFVSLVLAADGRAYVAWAHRPSPEEAELRVDVWNGTTLVSALSGLPAHPRNGVTLALDAHGRPMVAWLTPPLEGQHQPGIQVRVNH